MQNILFLHGALGASKDLEQLSKQLNNNFNVHSFSFSGHGGTPFKTTFGIETFVDELETFIAQKNLEDCCVFGYSMGGYVALNLALRQNHPLKKIITLGTKFNWNKETVDKETEALEPELMLQKVPAFVKSLEEKQGENWKELVLKTADLMREIERKNFLNNNNYKKITIPVLIGLADKDKMVSLEETTHVYRSLPNSSMYMLPGTKHPLETANVELLAKVISHFAK